MFNANRRLKVFIYHLDNDQDIVKTICDHLDLNKVDVMLPEDVEYRTVSEESDDERPQQARGQKDAFRRTVQNVDVAEWTSSLFTSYPYDSKDGREDPASTGPHSLRGGSWASAPAEILTYTRFSLDPTFYRNDLGFRCVRDVTR